MRRRPDATANWNIAWDDRGHFSEPHTGHEIGLGTLAVRSYIRAHRDLLIRNAGISVADVKTKGPDGRYGAVLFLEKEGFTQILEAAKIAERYDLAIMSTKGMSVTAARTLVEDLCGKRGLKLFVLHDFDVAGFSIKQTLVTSNRRYSFRHAINFIDLGLRLTDVEEMELDAEPTSINERRGRARQAAAHQRRDRGRDRLPARWRARRTERHDIGRVRRIRRAQAQRDTASPRSSRRLPRWPRPSPPSGAARRRRRRSRPRWRA